MQQNSRFNVFFYIYPCVYLFLMILISEYFNQADFYLFTINTFLIPVTLNSTGIESCQLSMADVLVGVVSSAAAPPLYAWASHRGCAWDRRNPSRAETAWNMTTNIRYKNRMMKSGNVLLCFYSVFTRFDWWDADDFSLPACASPADADAAHDDDDDGRIQRTVRWETTNFTTFRNFTFHEFGSFP